MTGKIYKMREGIEYFDKHPEGNYGELIGLIDSSLINKLEKSLGWLKFDSMNYKFKAN